jgi:hypothetical protein
MSDYIVTVCAECLMACCWHGELMCWESRGARTKDVRASELLKLGAEHPSNFSRAKLLKVCGSVQDVTT